MNYKLFNFIKYTWKKYTSKNYFIFFQKNEYYFFLLCYNYFDRLMKGYDRNIIVGNKGGKCN